MIRNFYILGLLCLFGSTVQAQDPSFSQFYANRVYLNPAFTGLESGITVAGVSRMQWLNVDQGFRTYGFNVELQEPALNSGIGLSLFHDQQGHANLQTSSVGLSYAYTIPFDHHNVHIGFQYRYVQKSIDWSKITFSDQLDPLYGAIYETTAVPINDRVGFSDFDVGIVWRFDTDVKLSKKRKLRDTRHSLGLSIHHLPQLVSNQGGEESFQNLNTKVSPRITLHAGSVIPVWFFNGSKKSISISPNIKYDIQGDQIGQLNQNLQVLTMGCYLLYEGVYIGGLYQNKRLIAGVQNTNAMIIAFGTFLNGNSKGRSSKNNMFLGLSYDANTTGVGSRAGGVIEVAFRWNFKDAPGLFGASNSSKRKSSNKKVMDCTKFF